MAAAAASAGGGGSTVVTAKPRSRKGAVGTAGQVSTKEVVQKTYEMLSDPGIADIVHWSEDGESFVVTDEGKFAKTVLPNFFRHNQFASFVRSLNTYGFAKRQDKNGHAIFKHAMFRRGQLDQLNLITKKPAKDPAVNESGAELRHTIAALQGEMSDMKGQITDLTKQFHDLWKMQHQTLYVLSQYMQSYPLPNLPLPGTGGSGSGSGNKKHKRDIPMLLPPNVLPSPHAQSGAAALPAPNSTALSTSYGAGSSGGGPYLYVDNGSSGSGNGNRSMSSAFSTSAYPSSGHHAHLSPIDTPDSPPIAMPLGSSSSSAAASAAIGAASRSVSGAAATAALQQQLNNLQIGQKQPATTYAYPYPTPGANTSSRSAAGAATSAPPPRHSANPNPNTNFILVNPNPYNSSSSSSSSAAAAAPAVPATSNSSAAGGNAAPFGLPMPSPFSFPDGNEKPRAPPQAYTVKRSESKHSVPPPIRPGASASPYHAAGAAGGGSAMPGFMSPTAANGSAPVVYPPFGGQNSIKPQQPALTPHTSAMPPSFDSYLPLDDLAGGGGNSAITGFFDDSASGLDINPNLDDPLATGLDHSAGGGLISPLSRSVAAAGAAGSSRATVTEYMNDADGAGGDAH